MTDKKGCTEVGQGTSVEGGFRGGVSELHRRV